MTSTMNSFKSVYMANGFRALARRPARTALAVGRKSRPLLNDKNDLRQDNYRNAFAVLLCGIAAELRAVKKVFLSLSDLTDILTSKPSRP